MRKLWAWGSCSSLLVQERARLPLPRTLCLSPSALAAMILPSGLAGTAFRGEFPMLGGHTATQSHQQREGAAVSHF